MSHASLTFALSVAEEAELLDLCLRRLRTALPDARVLVVTDDNDDPIFDTLAATHRAELTRGRPMYAQEAGGRWWREMLALDAEAPADHLFKIDPDTWVRRPFRALPNPEIVQVFGRPVLDDGFVHRPHMQGGCIGITRAAATALRESGLFDDPGYAQPAYARALCITAQHLEHRRATGKLSTDLIFADVCYRLDIPFVRHPEVHSLWLRAAELEAWRARGMDEPVNNPGDHFAVTHPHKV